MAGVVLYLEDWDRGTRFIRSNPAIRVLHRFGRRLMVVDAPPAALAGPESETVKTIVDPDDAALRHLSAAERLMLRGWFAERPAAPATEGLSWDHFGRGP